MVGDRLNVQCEVTGIPTPVITWLETCRLLLGAGIDIIFPHLLHGNTFLSRVIVDNATLADAGVYTCVGTNPAGTSREISVKVVMKPVIEILGIYFIPYY